MKRIATAAAFGWGVIVLLSWSLAQRRIGICGGSGYDASDIACRMRATAARDAVLTHGLTVLLIGAVIFALAQGGRFNGLGRRRDAPDAARAPFLSASPRSAPRSAWADRFRPPVEMNWPVWRRLVVMLIGVGVVAYVAFGIATASWPGIGPGPAPIATETAAEATDGAAEGWQAAPVVADPPAYSQ